MRPPGVTAALAVIVATTAVVRPGSFPLPVAGALDELGHAATGVLILAALGPSPRYFALGLLGSSLLIDLDHLPHTLGCDWLTDGTPRPYPHSLATVALLLVIAGAAVCPRRKSLRLLTGGSAVGLLGHFVRDLGEGGGGVPLLWPISTISPEIPRGAYVVLMFAIAAGGYARTLPDCDLVARLRRVWHRGRGRSPRSHKNGDEPENDEQQHARGDQDAAGPGDSSLVERSRT